RGGGEANAGGGGGTPWPEALGRTGEEFLDSAGRGLGIAGGAHGTAATIAADAYGVIAKYIAALAGFGPRDLPPLRHAACLAFAIGSLPFQFIPLVLAARSKAGERRAIDALAAPVVGATNRDHVSVADRDEVRRAKPAAIVDRHGGAVRGDASPTSV